MVNLHGAIDEAKTDEFMTELLVHLPFKVTHAANQLSRTKDISYFSIDLIVPVNNFI